MVKLFLITLSIILALLNSGIVWFTHLVTQERYERLLLNISFYSCVLVILISLNITGIWTNIYYDLIFVIIFFLYGYSQLNILDNFINIRYYTPKIRFLPAIIFCSALSVPVAGFLFFEDIPMLIHVLISDSIILFFMVIPLILAGKSGHKMYLPATVGMLLITAINVLIIYITLKLWLFYTYLVLLPVLIKPILFLVPVIVRLKLTLNENMRLQNQVFISEEESSQFKKLYIESLVKLRSDHPSEPGTENKLNDVNKDIETSDQPKHTLKADHRSIQVPVKYTLTETGNKDKITFFHSTSNELIGVFIQHPVDNLMVRQILTDLKYRISVFKTQLSLIQHLRDSPKTIDILIISDVYKKSELKVLFTNIRQIYNSTELPIIVISERDQNSAYIEYFQEGINDIIQKPIQNFDMASKLAFQNRHSKMIRELRLLKQDLEDRVSQSTEQLRLQNRMTPHFLFNALSTIKALLYSDISLADEAIVTLADIYRYYLEYSFQSLISVKIEWEFIHAYLSLVKIRFGERLRIEIDKSVTKVKNIKIPPMTLQPLVENAVKHGLTAKTGTGIIEVTFSTNGKTHIFSVSDNGKGIEKELDFSRSLGNIVKRMRFYYANADLSLVSNSAGGATVELKFSEFYDQENPRD